MEYYSASMLKLFNDCKFAFKCRYIDKIEGEKNKYLIFGTEFHDNIKDLTSTDENIINMVKSLRNAIKDRKIIEYEKKYFVLIDGYNFIGYVDAECKDHVLEFKSSNRKWYERDVLNNIIQSTMYQKMTGKKLEYYVVNKKTFWIQKITLEYNKKNWEKILNTIDRINTTKKYNKTNSYKCMYCSYKKICQK